jgi:hypothetical protein
MRRRAAFVAAALMAINLAGSSAACAQDQKDKTAKILSAKTVFWDDQTGNAAVSGAALAELKKWGRFQIVQDQSQADLILLLSADPFHGGSIILASGQTGSIDANGNVQPDPGPNHNKATPARDAYLTVIVPKTNEVLWSDSHVWGGVLTGKDSAGERLVKSLEKELGK